MANNKNPFVNVDFSKDMDLLDELEQMVIEDDLDRSKIIRKLIRQEIARRQAQQLPLPMPEQKNNARRKAIAA